MKPFIVANWKMNPQTLAEAKRLFNLVASGIKNVKNVEVVICPPFPYLFEFLSKWRKNQMRLGAQDCFWEEKGAFTGEVSPLMLKNLSVKYVILGHSERRRNLQETSDMVNKKLKAALKTGLRPILCVGDKNRHSKDDIKEIKSQLERGLNNLPTKSLSRLIITYEPVWAISTTTGAVVATSKNAREGILYIKKILDKLLGGKITQKIKILYGGSVDSKNINDFIYEAQADGVLVGAASLDAKEFIKLVKNVLK